MRFLLRQSCIRRNTAARSRRIQAAALAMLALLQFSNRCAGQEPCPGRQFGITYAPGGNLPYIELGADGQSGKFLLDYGATESSLSDSAFDAPGPAVAIAQFSLPGFGGGRFTLRRYNPSAQPAGGQLGVVGTDFLSLLSAHFTSSSQEDREVPLPCEQSEWGTDTRLSNQR